MTRPRVLLADDHKEVCDNVVRLLTPEFDVVGVVQDGRELLSAESDLLPDVCVIDISMPSMCGIEAARMLKANGSKAEIVFLTVHEGSGFRSGCSRYRGFGICSEVAHCFGSA